LNKPKKFTPEYFLARGFEREEFSEHDRFESWIDSGWVLYDKHGEDIAFVFVDCHSGCEESATLCFGKEGDSFPYDIDEPEWLDELLYAIWRIKPDETEVEVKA
jgi:hypothetical protein